MKTTTNLEQIFIIHADIQIYILLLLSKTKSKVVAIDETRPISLLPRFSKLFEKYFLIHFRRWIKGQGLLPAEKSSFRPGHNMAVRLVAIVDQIGQSLSKNTAAATLFVDFRTTFNQVWFKGLWLKLTRLHCPIYLIAWLRHYLMDSKAYINIKNTTSTVFNLSKGVPHGSCIDPVLFITYHHDILEALSTSNVRRLDSFDPGLCEAKILLFDGHSNRSNLSARLISQ